MSEGVTVALRVPVRTLFGLRLIFLLKPYDDMPETENFHAYTR